jgi:O-antigen/teichoic acid export membrane protein
VQIPDDFDEASIPAQTQISDLAELSLEQAPDPGKSEKNSQAAFRHQMGHVSQHSGVFFAGTIISAALGYLFKIYLARHLGARLLGLYTLGMTMVAPLSVFNGMGLTMAALRFVPVYRATDRPDLLRGFLVRSLGRLLLVNAVLSVALILVGPYIASHFYHTPELGQYMWLFASLLVLGILTMFLSQVLAGYKQIARRTVVTSIFGPSLTMALALLLISMHMGLRGYILAQTVAGIITGAVLTALVWKYTPVAARQMHAGFPRIESQVISYALATLGLGVFEYLMRQTDKVVLGSYWNPRDVGIYSVAATMGGFVNIVLRSTNQVFAPMISDLTARHENQLLGRLFQTLTKWVIGLTLPLAAGIVIYAAPLMRIFGPEFEAGAIVLVVGTVGQLVNCGVGSAGTILLMSGHQSSLIWIEGFAAALMVVLNLLLVPHWGIAGAAVASSATLVATNVLYLVLANRKTGLFPYNKSYWRLGVPAVASCGLLVLTRYIPASGRELLVVFAVGLTLSYAVFVGLSALFGLDDDDKLIVGAMWDRVRGIFSKLGFQR